jgi:Anti-sigma factor NepR
MSATGNADETPTLTIAAPALDQDIHRLLGLKLKSEYDEILRQALPDRIRVLLEYLERKEAAA